MATTHPYAAPRAHGAAYAVLFAVTGGHLINDTLQALLLSIYPLLRDIHSLSFAQVGFITLAFQATASVLQPLVGLYTDKRPIPFSLPFAPALTLIGLVVLGMAGSYAMILVGAALIGIGSSIFHPEASRLARLSSGGRYGFAQSLFQVGGNFGTSVGPLLAAFFVIPHGQGSVAWFAVLALVSVAVLGFRRRPLGNGLLLAGFALAAAGSALAGLGAARTAAFVAIASCLLYAGSVART
jgi:FSR family fosmidomycin resistance protein-like MFS transporter